MASPNVQFYIDFKSPYAYLAVGPARELENETGIQFDWLPYTLDIPSYLGDATVDVQGNVIAQNRNAHQWRRVKYSYMDCRREANRQNLTVRGPKKIFDSSLANIGLIFAKNAGVEKKYIDTVFARFWKRELDIEDVSVVSNVLSECGAQAEDFSSFASGQGREQLLNIQTAAEDCGVFGVPSILVDGRDLYWGREHFPQVRELLRR